MNEYEALSYCGIYCGACTNFKKNMNCLGCRNEQSLVDDCPTRDCAIGRGLLHCGECVEFPCKILNDFYHDGKPSHLSALDNMREIISRGADNWLLEQGNSR